MGEEVKKTEGAKKPGEEEKKEEKSAEKHGVDKKEDESKEAGAPSPPPEILLRVFMHCEGCARKVRRCLRGFEGVEDVITDCKTHKVVVKGENADPLKVLERVQRKSHRKVELLSPIPKPKPPTEVDQKVVEKESPKPEKKAEAPGVIAVLKVHMHCEACAEEIKKRILRMKGVEGAEPDLKGSQVTVKGNFEPPKLAEYVYKRTGKHALIVRQEPENKEEDKPKDEKEEKKVEQGDKEKKAEDAIKVKKEGEEAKPEALPTAEQKPQAIEEGPAAKAVELKKSEFYYYPPTYATELYYSQAHPPQLFSDENPNACSVM